MAKSSSPHPGSSGARAPRPAGPAAETVAPGEAAAAAVAPARKLRPIDLVAAAKEQLKELTGYAVDSVAGFKQSDDGWSLTVTVLELNRIPTATDVLAEYVVDLDAEGDITGYRRGRRFYRGEVGAAE